MSEYITIGFAFHLLAAVVSVIVVQPMSSLTRLKIVIMILFFQPVRHIKAEEKKMRKIAYHCTRLIILFCLTLSLLGTSLVSGAQSDYEVAVKNFLIFLSLDLNLLAKHLFLHFTYRDNNWFSCRNKTQ